MNQTHYSNCQRIILIPILNRNKAVSSIHYLHLSFQFHFIWNYLEFGPDVQGQHPLFSPSPSCCLNAWVCITSIRDIRGVSGEMPWLCECSLANLMASIAGSSCSQAQQIGFCGNKDWLSPNLNSELHFGFSHANWHFGFGQRVGVLHFQAHFVFSQSGVQLGSGAVQVVRQTAGRQTVSHEGQFFDSHISFGHRTEQTGSSQRTSHWAHPVGSQFIWHFGRAQTGWHFAGHTGSSQSHLHWGWHVVAALRATTASTPTAVTIPTKLMSKTNIFIIICFEKKSDNSNFNENKDAS